MGIPVVFMFIMRVPFLHMMIIQVILEHVTPVVVWSIEVIVMFSTWV